MLNGVIGSQLSLIDLLFENYLGWGDSATNTFFKGDSKFAFGYHEYLFGSGDTVSSDSVVDLFCYEYLLFYF